VTIAALEIDPELFYEALDRRRRHSGMRRRDVAQLLGVSAASVTYWSQGHGVSADVLLRGCTWLDVHPLDFARHVP